MDYVKNTYNYTYNYVYDFIFAKKCILVIGDGTQTKYRNLTPNMPLGDLIEMIMQSEFMIGKIRNDMSIYHDANAIHLFDLDEPISKYFKSKIFYLHATYLHNNDFMKSLEQYRYYNISSV